MTKRTNEWAYLSMREKSVTTRNRLM